METSKLIYKGANYFNFLKYLAYRVGIVFICLFAGRYFNDNPVGISIVFGIAVLFILILGDDEIHVYSDKVVTLSNSLFGLIFHTRSKVYKIDDIQRAYIEEDDEAPGIAGNIFITIFQYVYPKIRRSKDNPGISLEFKNGETKELMTELDEDVKKIIIYKINSLIK